MNRIIPVSLSLPPQDAPTDAETLNWLLGRDPDACQASLTDALLKPALADLLSTFRGLRQELDPAFRYHRASLSGRGLPASGSAVSAVLSSEANALRGFVAPYARRLQDLGLLADYPVGACFQITICAFDDLRSRGFETHFGSLIALRRFIDHGGWFLPIWGVVRGRYFQTAFQVGNHYLDIANDTVDPTKPQIDHAPLRDSGFERIDSFPQYARVKSAYHSVKLLKNRCFRELSALFPLFVVDHQCGSFCLDANRYMARLSVRTDYLAADRFLTDDRDVPDPCDRTAQAIRGSALD